MPLDRLPTAEAGAWIDRELVACETRWPCAKPVSGVRSTLRRRLRHFLGRPHANDAGLGSLCERLKVFAMTS